MATDLKGLRSAVELLTEQVSKLAALGNQQIEAIARLAPLMVQSAEGISGGLRDVVSAVRSMSSSPPPASEAIQPAAEAMRVEEQLARQLELLQELDPAIGSEAEPAPRMVKARRKSNQNPPAKKIEGSAPKAASAPVVVKSIPDAKRSDRFYTTVRLPREVWDSAGFGSDDRLLIDWTGKVLTISRATEGGIKPKTIGATAVVLQSWKLGNLNIDQPRVSCEDTSLRLTVRR